MGTRNRATAIFALLASTCSAQPAAEHASAAADATALDATLPALASPGAAATEKPAEPEAPVVKPAPFTLTLGSDFTTAYFFRGIRQEDSGFIAQPYAQIQFTLDTWEDGELKLDLQTWNSLHSLDTGAPSDADSVRAIWYECDLLAGLSARFDAFTFRVGYTILTSPNGGWKTIMEIPVSVALDDSRWLGAFALSPTATLVIETSEHGADGAELGHGVYLELSATPGLNLTEADRPVRLVFPTLVGLGLSNYYQNAAGKDQGLGFFETGAKVIVPLTFIGGAGSWTLTGGVRVLVLGDGAREFNAKRGQTEVIGVVGVSVSF